MAMVHAAAFPSGQIWGPDAIALQTEQPGAFALMHDEGGFVIARVAADEAEILTIAVHPAARARGIARALMVRATTEAAQRGAVSMLLEVSDANDAARALYASLGFVMIGRRARYYADGADALVLRAELPAST